MDIGFLKGLVGRRGFPEALVSKAIALNTGSPQKIVFADMTDEVLKAASIVKRRRIAQPLIIGDSGKLDSAFRRLGLSNLDDENTVDHLLSENSAQLESFVSEFIGLRLKDGKPISDKEAREKMEQPHYYAAMMVHKGLAHGFISGAKSSTKPYYPVFDIIKMAPGVNKTSGAFLMVGNSPDKVFFCADCVMNMTPNSEQLAEIAMLTARTAACFGVEPRVAMLSFSTRSSAKHDSVERIKLATAMVKRRIPDLVIDGEIQLDAATDPAVMRKKCPDSPLQGAANVLVFPELNSGNIGYKLLERLGNYQAIGPFLQGTRKAANDLSRGCSADDIVLVAAATVLQSKACELHAKMAEEAAEAGEASVAGESGPDVKPRSSPEGSGPKPKKPSSTYKLSDDPLDRLPSNVKKIIEEGMNGVKKKRPDE